MNSSTEVRVISLLSVAGEGGLGGAIDWRNKGQEQEVLLSNHHWLPDVQLKAMT